MARRKVAVQHGVALRVIVAALDEDAGEDARGDLGRRLGPHERGARRQRDRVRLDVAEDEDLARRARVRGGGRFGPDEVRRAVDDALVVRRDGHALRVRVAAGEERRPWLRREREG